MTRALDYTGSGMLINDRLTLDYKGRRRVV